MSVKDLPSHDLLGLAMAPMRERVAALQAEWSRTEESGPLPSRAVQVAGLVVGETVRLIRLGNRSEVTGAARELSKLVARYTPDAADRHPESYRLAAGASVVLGAAGSPSSAGAELAVLRSWNGKAQEAVEILSGAHDKALARSELRTALGDLTESHLSHLLADLESAGLALKIKEGRTVTVHLGPIGKSDHVQQRLRKEPLPVRFHSTERDIDPGLRRQSDRVYKGVQAALETLPSVDLKVHASHLLCHYFQKPLDQGQAGRCRELPDWEAKTVVVGHAVSTEGWQRPRQVQVSDDEAVAIADFAIAAEK